MLIPSIQAVVAGQDPGTANAAHIQNGAARGKLIQATPSTSSWTKSALALNPGPRRGAVVAGACRPKVAPAAGHRSSGRRPRPRWRCSRARSGGPNREANQAEGAIATVSITLSPRVSSAKTAVLVISVVLALAVFSPAGLIPRRCGRPAGGGSHPAVRTLGAAVLRCS